MISLPLYKKEIKSQLPLFLIFSVLVLMYGMIVVTLFNPDPEAAGWLDSIIVMYPEMMDLIGFNIADFTNYQLFISGYLYGMLFLLFGLIYSILVTNRLIFRYLDKGSFVYLISTPNSRTKILFTQIKVLGTYLFGLSLLMYLVVTIPGLMAYGDYVDPIKLLYLNASYFILLLFLSSINVLFTTLFEGKKASILSIAVPVLFFFINMIANLDNGFKWFEFFTPFSLFNTDLIINLDELSFLFNGILLLLSGLMYFITFKLFNRRDLNI